MFVKDPHQVKPGCISELKLLQVRAQTGLQPVGSDKALELPHDDGSLLIDDGAVEAARLVQILQLLAERMSSGGSIHRIGRRVIGDKKSKVVVHLRKRADHNFCRHEVSKNFFHPDIIEPLHCNEVAKPHVRGLVRDYARAI